MNSEEFNIQRNRNLVKSSTQPMPLRSMVGDKARQKMDNSEAAAQRKSVENNPDLNPAGKGQFTGAYAPYGDRSDHYTYAKPDARHAARLRGKAAAASWQEKAKGKAK